MILPLYWIKQMEVKYPNWDEEVALIRRALENHKIYWNSDLCYIPISATLEITRRNLIDAAIIAAFTPWKRHKEIYHFHTELGNLLIAQDDDMKLPIDIFYKLPYHCIYIDLSNLQMDFDGVWVHLEEDYHTKRIELRFLYACGTESVLPFSLHLTDIDPNTGEIINAKSVYDAWNKSMEETSKYDTINIIDKTINKQDVYNKLFCQTIQLLLYILAENADIKQNPIQRKKYKKPGRKNDLSEVRQWDLGDKIFYRKNPVKHNMKQHDDQAQNISHNVSSRSAKRPHSRRAHWHHFWVGGKNSPDRHLVLKWINPMIINAQQIDKQLGTTINIISK